VDLTIAVALISTEFASVAATVREAKFAACAVVAVVTPVVTVTVQVVYAGKIAPPAVKVSVAPGAPELMIPVEKVVLPQPLYDGVARPASVKDGNTTLTTSLISIGTLICSANTKNVAAPVTVVPNVSSLCVTIDAGAAVAVEVGIAMAPISVAPANVTATVLVLRSPSCACVLKVKPEPTVIMHEDPASRSALFAVRVSFAVAPLELVPDVNVVVPQPLLVVGVAGEEIDTYGKIRSRLSPIASFVLNANLYVIAPAVLDIGLTKVKTLVDSAGSTKAVDLGIFPEVAAIFVPLANVIATVLLLWFASRGVPLMVRPAPTDTAQRTPAAIGAPAAVNVTAAPAFVESDPAAVNVVVPHPLLEILVGTTVKLGSTILTVSPMASTVLVEKKYETVDVVPVTGVAISKALLDKAGAGTGVEDIAGEVVMAVEDASVALERIADAVRDVESALCAPEGVVTPVWMFTVHSKSAESVAVAAVRVMAADADPE